MASSKKKTPFYVTTPIYYVNDVPHIGHAYTTVAADALARYKRLKGFDVFFLTGTDEHGQKVEKAAATAGKTPKELADAVVERYRELWKRFCISNDAFIRTTDPEHKKAAQELWTRAKKNGDIYLGEYEDWYCTPCETFVTETQLNEGKCPDCLRPVEKLKETSYFFKLSAYGEKIKAHIEDNPGFISPEAKKNEILGFLREGLRDLSVSRTTFKWGIEVPGDPVHVMYVWFDALTNYIAAAGYASDEERFKKYWPADLHLIGKDILRFHAVYWPAFLLSAGIPLPKKVFAHGWWTVEERKMSKSIGNVVDPFDMADRYGVDQFRFFLLREVPFGLDGDFSEAALKGRINSELANGLGNLLSRTVSMIEKYREGQIPAAGSAGGEAESAVKERFSDAARARFDASMEDLKFSDALETVWLAVRDLNAYVDKKAPWALAKEKKEDELSTTLWHLAEGLRIIAIYLFPFMPDSAKKVWSQLGITGNMEEADFDNDSKWGAAKIDGLKVSKGAALFPKAE